MIEDAIRQLTAAAVAAAGMKKNAGGLPRDAYSTWPAVLVYALSGSVDSAPAGSMTGLHNVVVEILVSAKDLSRDLEFLTPFIETIPRALLAALEDGRLPALQTFGQIDYQYISTEYGSTAVRGYRFVINAVKIQTATH